MSNRRDAPPDATEHVADGATCLKILTGEEYRRLQADGVFEGSPADRADGFVHLSLPHQVEETAAKHFAGQDGLWLLAIPAKRLGDALRLEPSRGGDLFPHLYGPLRLEHVEWARPLPLEDGRFVFPDLAAPGA